MKTLTISIAAYNIESTIHKAVESCIHAEIIDDVEIIIINDGSKDATSEIAHTYEKNYPKSIRVIDKKNEGYGSTVNCSINMASGKYFKLLDGDDWLVKKGIINLVNFLKKTDADIVLSNRVLAYSDEEVVDNPKWLKLYGHKEEFFSTKSFDNLKPFIFGMWFETVRTDILRRPSFHPLPVHTLYTDQLFVTYSLAGSNNIAFTPDTVYCYRVGVNEQSSSVKSREQHFSELIKVTDMIIDYYNRIGSLSSGVDSFLKLRVTEYYWWLIKTVFLFKAKAEYCTWIKKYDQALRSKSMTIYESTGERYKTLRLLRKITYKLYWVRKIIRPVKDFVYER